MGNEGNARECLWILEAIESSKFRDLSARWSSLGMLTSSSPRRTEGGADDRLYNLFTSHFISEVEATVVIRCMDRRVPSCHRIGWNYSEIDDDFVGSNADVASLLAYLRDSGNASDSAGEKVEVNDDAEV